MKTYQKTLIFVLTFLATNFFLVKNSSALTFSSPEEVCVSELFSESCEVSDGKVTLNLTSPLELDSSLVFRIPELEINDLTSGDSPTIIFNSDSDEEIFVFDDNSNIIINNLKVKTLNFSKIFSLNNKTNLTLNGGQFIGGYITDSGFDSVITFNNSTVIAEAMIVDSTRRAEKITFNGGVYKTSHKTLLYLSIDQTNVEITSGLFESTSDLAEARVFYVLEATADEAQSAIERFIAEDALIYDVAHETYEIVYDELDLTSSNPDFADEKGVFNFGVLSSDKILITKKDGRGEETKEEESEDLVKDDPEEPSEASNVAEPVEAEENPDTLVDNPALYFFVVILTTAGLVISAKKYLES